MVTVVHGRQYPGHIRLLGRVLVLATSRLVHLHHLPVICRPERGVGVLWCQLWERSVTMVGQYEAQPALTRTTGAVFDFPGPLAPGQGMPSTGARVGAQSSLELVMEGIGLLFHEHL